jgi:hypothetical protein
MKGLGSTEPKTGIVYVDNEYDMGMDGWKYIININRKR